MKIFTKILVLSSVLVMPNVFGAEAVDPGEIAKINIIKSALGCSKTNQNGINKQLKDAVTLGRKAVIDFLLNGIPDGQLKPNLEGIKAALMASIDFYKSSPEVVAKRKVANENDKQMEQAMIEALSGKAKLAAAPATVVAKDEAAQNARLAAMPAVDSSDAQMDKERQAKLAAMPAYTAQKTAISEQQKSKILSNLGFLEDALVDAKEFWNLDRAHVLQFDTDRFKNYYETQVTRLRGNLVGIRSIAVAMETVTTVETLTSKIQEAQSKIKARFGVVDAFDPFKSEILALIANAEEALKRLKDSLNK